MRNRSAYVARSEGIIPRIKNKTKALFLNSLRLIFVKREKSCSTLYGYMISYSRKTYCIHCW